MRPVDIDALQIKIVIYTLIAFWFFGSIYFACSTLEQNFAKIRINQSIQNVEYDKQNGYFCWDWYSIKVRDLYHRGGRVRLADANGVELLLPMFTRDTHVPWVVNPPVSTGKVINQGLCAFIPPGWQPKSPFTVDAYVVYPGLLNLWRLRTYLPQIIYQNDSGHDTLYSNPKVFQNYQKETNED